MRITSKSTYILPFLILFIATYFLLFFLLGPFTYRFIDSGDETTYYTLSVLLPVIVGVGLFFVFKEQAMKFNWKYFKYVLLLFPIVLKVFIAVAAGIPYRLPVDSILCGLFLYYSYVLFSNRYMASLNETAIGYKNLLGQTGNIPLTAITKVEQKSYLFSMFKEIKLLETTQKTAIAFCDEEMDEYEVNIYCRAFKSKDIFDKIVANANHCGNNKVRLYTT